MTEVLTSLVRPAMEELGGLFVAIIKRHFNYLCCFNSNIQSLRDEVKQLKNESVGLQERVDAIDRNKNKILSAVETWLEDSKEMQLKTDAIEDGITNIPSSCLAIKSRYKLSKKVKKTADAMKVLREGCDRFKERISTSIPTVPASKTSYAFDSRTPIEEKIKKDLKGGNVHMVGIYGMGGVGKTTMAKRIANKMREENLFDEVVMAVVSQDVSKQKIQGDIANYMGFTLPEDVSLPARAKTLADRLKGESRILLILDDVWEGLNLEDLGIPCRSDRGKGCKIILTSRSRDVLYEMRAERTYETNILFAAEAWSLFRENVVGTWVDDYYFLDIVKQVAEECNGLPLALITVGTTLKDKRDIRFWINALDQLKRANPVDIPMDLKKVYEPIKLSYDFLDTEDAKYLFLLCCMFPEDHEIHIEYLTMYAMGLHMFKQSGNLEDARDTACALLQTLKDRSLLLDGRDMNHVKMHDVIRDVAKFIASEEGKVDRDLSSKDCSIEQSTNCTWISVFEEKEELPIGLSFPSLRLLLIDNYSTPLETNISFFKRMIELNVLSFSSMSFRSLPETTNLLQKLGTLYLVSCTSLETISPVGELLSLEVLICRSCHKIVELPVEIKGLKRLKVLEVSNCWRLKRIAPGVISNLIELQELQIIESFNRWETKEGTQRNNASFGELELLSKLRKLHIDIWGALATEEIRLSPEIVRYQIRLNKTVLHKRQENIESYSLEKSIHLELKKDITFGEWLQQFVRSTEYLYASGDGAHNLELAQSQNMKKLIYRDCSTVNKLVNIATSASWNFGVFPLLEYLELHQLPNLEEIFKVPTTFSFFGSLKELKVSECGKLRRLLPLAIARDGLVQLEELQIEYCEQMKEVFTTEEDGEQRDRITFPKLKFLKLHTLPKLTTFYNGSESIEFPLLDRFFIGKCDKLTSLISCTRGNPNLEGHDDDSFHLFCNQKIMFGCLKYITLEAHDTISNIWCREIPRPSFFRGLESLAIDYCDGIISLFPCSIVENLVSLRRLSIRGCKEMIKVIEDDEMLNENAQYPRFPSLEELDFIHLPKLQSFCNWRLDLELPSLGKVSIHQCPLLEYFTQGSVRTPKLRTIHIDSEFKDVEDLNGAIQQQFERKQEEQMEEEKIKEADSESGFGSGIST